jgi:hypothetical protein
LLTLKQKKAEEAPKLTAEEEEAIKKKAIEEYLRQQQAEKAPDPIAEENAEKEKEEAESAPSENE